MLENTMGVMATLWLQSGFVAVCGLVTARFVQKRSATLAATVLRATWIGVALCLVLSATSFGSLASRRALWNVALPATSLQTAAAPTPPLQADSLLTTEPATETAIESLPSTSPGTTTAVSEPDFAGASAPSSTRSSTEIDGAALVQTPAPSAVAATSIATHSRQKPLSILNVLFALWLAGSATLLLWTAFCAWQMRRVVRTSTRIEDGAWRDELHHLCALLRVREPLLLRSDLARSPFLTGLIRPCIVLPRGDFGTSQRFVLLHELTHLQRRDLWWNAASRVLCAVLWMQPLLWMLQRAGERIGEEVCDEAVVSRGESARQYAQCLLDLAQSWRPTRGERTLGAGVVPLRSGLARRIQNILDESRRRTMIVSRGARWIIGISTLGIVAASLSLVAVQANPTVSAESSTRNVDLSSPGGVVRAFASALNAKDLDTAARYVENGAPLVNLDLQAQINKAKFSIAVSDFKTKITGTTALVTFSEAVAYFGNRKAQRSPKTRRTTLSLRRSNGRWQATSLIPGRSGPNASLLQEATEMLAPRFKSKLTAWAKNRGKASIVGRVLDDNGRPVPNARIHVTMISENVLRQFGGRDIVYQVEFMNIAPRVTALFNQHIQTASDGTFRFDGLTSARYRVEARTWAKDLAKQSLEMIPTEKFLVTAREGSSTRSPNLKMLTGIPVSVRVVESGTREPLAGVDVTLNSIRNQKPVFFVTRKTDANGRASLVSLQGRSHVMLKSNFVKRLNGLYIVSNGVTYLPFPKAGDKVPRPVWSTYAIGRSVLVSHDKPNEVVFELQRYVAPKTASTSDIRASNQSTGFITGRVVRADGRPAAGVRMGIWFQPEAARSNELSAWGQPMADAVEHLLTKEGGKLTARQTLNKIFDIRRKFGQADITRADGTYRLSVMASTRFNVLVDTYNEIYVNRPSYILPDWVEAGASPTGIAPKASVTARIADVVLTRGAIIRGRVLDRATRQPLPNVFITCHRSLNQPSGVAATSARTDAQGRYVMRVAPSARYVYVGGNGYMGGTYIGVRHLTATVHSGDSPPYVKELNLIKTGNDLYNPNAWIQVQLDNAAPRWTQVGPETRHFEISTRLGQTRTLDFLLDKLIVKRKGGNTDVYIPGKPR